MKRKQILQIILTICLITFMLLTLTTKVEAASTSLTASSTNVTVGTKVTITASGNAASWDLEISGDGISSTKIVGYTDDSENGNFSKSISFTPSKAGTYTIKLTGNITDEGDIESTSVSKTVSITVKEKETSSGGNSSSGSDNEDNKQDTPTMSFSSVNQTVYATDSLNVRESYSTDSDIIGSLSVGQSVTRTGIGDGWSRITYDGRTAYVISSGISTEKPETNKEEKEEESEEKEEQQKEEEQEDNENKSNVKTLSSLTVEQYSLTPEFDPDITEYSLTVGADVEKLDIGVIAEDPKSTVEIVGNNELLIGENTVNVKVTAEDGTVKTYTINVTKVDEVGVQLSELSIENYTLTPEFSSDVYEYTLNIGDPSITSLNVNAKSDEENVNIEIVGNNELKLGDNVITILVTSEEDNLTTTYQIVVNIDEAYAQDNQIIAGIDDNDLFMYIGIGVLVLIVLIIVIVVIIRKHKYSEEEDDDFAPLNTYDLDFSSKNDEPIKIEKKDGESKDVIIDSNEKENKNDRKEKKEELSSITNSNSYDTNETTRKKGKHF